MNRTIRIALACAGILALLFAAVVCIALLVVDPNEHKARLESLIQEATGKTAAFQGDLALSVFPGISIKAGPILLADDPSFGPEPFLKLENLRASVAILPLFRGDVSIEDVELSGIRLKLAVNPAGKTNWEMNGPDGAGKTPPRPSSDKAPAKDSGSASLAVSSLVLRDALILYTDMRDKRSMQFTVSRFTLDALRPKAKTNLALDASCEGATRRPLALSLKAGFTLPETLAEGTNFTLDGKLNDTAFSGKGFVSLPQSAAGKEFSLTGDIAFGNIDWAAFAPVPAKTASAPANGKTPASAAPATPATGDDAATAEMLRKLFLNLYITAKSVTVANIPIKDITATIKADQGIIAAKPVSMTIASAPLTLEASLDAKGRITHSRLTGEWKKARVDELIHAATGKKHLSGALDASWTLNATGLAWPAAANTLGGKAALLLGEGAIPAFPLIPEGVSGLPAQTLDIPVTRCSATWDIVNGVARTEDFQLQSPVMKANGGGRIDIPSRTVNFKAVAELANLPLLPLVVSGPLSSPSYGVDKGELLRQMGKTLLDPASQTGKGLGGAVKGLFGK